MNGPNIFLDRMHAVDFFLLKLKTTESTSRFPITKREFVPARASGSSKRVYHGGDLFLGSDRTNMYRACSEPPRTG